MNNQSLVIPEVGQFLRHIGKLVSIETIQPPPETHYIFEDIEARGELRLNGEVIKHLGTLSDFFGLGTSVKNAIKEMKEYCQQIGITKNSDVEAVVIRVVSQFRTKPIERENFYAKGYSDFERVNRWDGDLPEPTETIVWSSKE